MSFKYTGFSFNGVHSDSIPVVAATVSRPIVPEMRRVTITPDASDGEVDISAANALGRALYEERTFSANLLVTAADIYGLQVVLTKAANWLNGSGELIFDDLPGIIWDATVEKEIDYAPEREGRKAIISVDFTVKPFGRGQATTGEDVLLGSDVVLGSDAVTVGATHAGTTTWKGTAGSAWTVGVEGTAPAAPVFHVVRTDTAGGAAVYKIYKQYKGYSSLTTDPYEQAAINARGDHANIQASLEITTDCLDFYIDMDKKCIIGKNATTGKYEYMTPNAGAFFELDPGATVIYMQNPNYVWATITFDYTPRYLY